MTVTGTRKVGEFCWINMITPQPAEAREFFGHLLGWTYSEWPGMGHGIHVGGRDIGGLFDLNGPNTPAGTPASIGVVVKVSSADATADKVVELGGTMRPAFDIEDSGRMAVCFDPNGAQFDVWEPNKMPGTDVDDRLHGAPSWFETITNDVDRAAKFYAQLFGWTPETMSMPGMPYTVFKLGGVQVAGMMQISADMGPMQPHWGIYFTVNDADQTARLAAELGGNVFIPTCDIPNIGRFCGIISPQGVKFYAIQYVG